MERLKKVLILIFSLFLIAIVSASECPTGVFPCDENVNFNNPVFPAVRPGSSHNISTNVTNTWNTNIGNLDDVNNSQFENNGNVLSIIQSFLTNLISVSGLQEFLSLSGSNANQNIDVSPFNFQAQNITIIDTFFFGNTNHWIRKGALGFDGISTNAISIQHKEEHPEGTITFMVTANVTGKDEDVVSIMAQAGLNNSGGYLGNSWMVAPNNLTINLTDLSNCFFVINATGNTPRIFCDTFDTGSDFFVQDDIQSGGTVFADGGIRAETLADFIMNGRTLDIQNGSLHIFTQVEFVSGVDVNQEVTTFNEFFTGGIGSFTNLQVDFGNWFATSNVLCDDGDCANSVGISGAGNIIMESNISTTNINNTRLNFVYSLVNMLGANDFSVIIENSTDTVIVFIDSTNNVILSQQSIDIAEFSNQAEISIRFECDVTQPNRQCFVDTIRVNGTAIASTLTNQSGFNSEICFSDGVRGADGNCLTGILFNATLNTVFPQGNWNFTDVSVGGVSHSALTNLEWVSAGHTFSSTGKTLDILGYNFTAKNITADIFFGDGSQLTGIVGDNSSWNESRANDLYCLLTNDCAIDWTGATQDFETSGNVNVDGGELGAGLIFSEGFKFIKYKEAPDGANLRVDRARGTKTSPDYLNANDVISNFNYRPWAGASFATNNAQFGIRALQNHGTFDRSTKYQMSLTASGATAMQVVLEMTTALANFKTTDIITTGDLFLKTNNKKLFLGTGSDASIFYDATNLRLVANESGNGIVFVDTNLSALNLIDRTIFWDKSLGSSLDYVKDSDNYKNDLGTGWDDTKLSLFEQATYPITDFSRPVNESYEVEVCEVPTEEICNNEIIGFKLQGEYYQPITELVCREYSQTDCEEQCGYKEVYNNGALLGYKEVCGEVCVDKEPVCNNETNYRIIYPYKKNDTGRLVSAVIGKHEQNIFDLKQIVYQQNNTINLMKSSLCNLGEIIYC